MTSNPPVSDLFEPSAIPVPAPTIGPFLANARIAYFSMEIALRTEMHTYSGGLGVLAGDTVRAAADLELPMVFVTLLSRMGYLRQGIDASGAQLESADPWAPEHYAVPLRAKVAVIIEGREVWVRPWLYRLQSALGNPVPVLLLDTDLPENAPQDRCITDTLYGGDQVYRFKQEIVLGIAGLRALQALGFRITTYHLNEGHAALLALDLLRRHPRPADTLASGALKYDVAPVRAACIFTTHTPVDAGHDRFPYALFEHLLHGYFDSEQVRLLAGRHDLNMSLLALNLCGYVNGVAMRHARTAKEMFPGYHIRAVTNGVHVPSWAHREFSALFNEHARDWGYDPEVFVRMDQLPDDAVWNAHRQAKSDLIEMVSARTGTTLDPEQPVFGFARRMTAYKRPDLLFTDIERLREINAKLPFQVVLAGKAHPRDQHGKDLIRRIHELIRELAPDLRIVFVPNYDLDVGRRLVAGADVWLNTPLPPLEASGTSGMKAAVNGVLNLSVLDGWWVEACIEGVTGWAIDDHDEGAEHASQSLYEKLEHTVLPLYYHQRSRWIWMMKQSISKIASYFNSHRMMRRYAAEAYIQRKAAVRVDGQRIVQS